MGGRDITHIMVKDDTRIHVNDHLLIAAAKNRPILTSMGSNSE